MTLVESIGSTAERLLGLVRCVQLDRGFAAVVASLQAGHAATVDGAWGSGSALAVAALAEQATGPLVVVLPRADLADDFLDDLALFTTARLIHFPAWEALPGEGSLHDETAGERLRLLKELAAENKGDRSIYLDAASASTARSAPGYGPIVVSSIQALVQPVPDPIGLAGNTRTLRVGEEIDEARFARWLVEAGFHATSAVELPGEFAVRGGIVDVFAADWQNPVRVEFYGDRIESLRAFDVAGQRSLARLEAVGITSLRPTNTERAFFTDYLPATSWIVFVELAELRDEGRQYRARLERADDCHDVEAVIGRAIRFPSVALANIGAGSLETTCHLRMESVERFSGDVARVRDELDRLAAGQQVFVVCQTEAEIRRLREVFGGTQLAAQERLHFPLGRLQGGFRLVPDAIVVISSTELFHRSELKRPARRRLAKVIDSFLELREGDLVVHVSHGVARYRGLELLAKEEQSEEHLVLEFQGGTKLYVPSSKIGLVQKYVGGAKSRPTLARLGGRLWSHQKEKVQRAVTDLAAEMLELQGARASRPGIAFAADSDWQREFDASFPYEETDDQLITIEAIKRDMAATRPMDRLLCGDVGYGKTELAMRAAFKAVDAGYQVAILVPTTVLAEQHLRTFTARMAEFPFSIAALSRFATRKEQGAILGRLADGSVDIVIGTHRLVQPDVQFHNIGLVIIDEEQRFGVEVKERLKAFRTIVDVLTMTATPIPRTLHMSLLGLRDISNLETPPAERMAVETHVTRFDAEMIRHAVLRELNRNGQVFFVHNRVQDIEILARRLSQIVPEASLRVAHGQMPEHELEEVMLGFVGHKFDILLATTIVESGLDIPNANTIFIDEADRYGLADLHQLRGRVGRYKHRAYCYLLLDPNKQLSPLAAKRLRAIEEFSEMGAGFAIAMRDLEIRGAGNILGAEQSGHIAVVGYELYCDLLDATIRRLKALPPKTSVEVDIDLPGEAYLPRTYVPDMRLKIDLYRRLGRVTAAAELDDFRTELVDRFGPIPPLVTRLLLLAELRIAAHRWQIQAIRRENVMDERYFVMSYAHGPTIRKLAAQSGGRLRVVDEHTAYLPVPQGVTESDGLLTSLKSVLQR